MMMMQTFRTAFALLLLVAPLGAALCGDCVGGDCEPAERLNVVVMPEGPDETSVTPPCHEAEATIEDEAANRDEPAPCHDDATATALSACCALAATPAPEQAIAPALAFSVVISLEAAIDADRPAVVPTRSGPCPIRSWRPPSEPLYTLHSVFLI